MKSQILVLLLIASLLVEGIVCFKPKSCPDKPCSGETVCVHISFLNFCVNRAKEGASCSRDVGQSVYENHPPCVDAFTCKGPVNKTTCQ
ncbi:hypothetical protein JTE90_001302 [Oedothorax gibbosus]|uniref:Uncharacterized protein n=1 Tax=Oedothorax gibbosus TaxID=931172 RepID=A0AAV6TT96_9ARAC|nr:hypothetical protein JTE90_001302 [Oedothorax gibbosus]